VYHVYHQYTVHTKKRGVIQDYLKEKGIATMVYYPFPLHKMKVFDGRIKMCGDLRHSQLAAEEVFSLPIEPLQKEEDTEYIIRAVREFKA
jgi:dTDP-4-amino-4,6-dideoxygalactose transaminase